MPLYLKDKLVSGTGAPGKSAYQTAVEAGYGGTETAFNEALKDVPGHIADTENPHGVTAAQAGAIASTEKGAASGVATLGADALLAAAQRPKAGGLYRDNGTTTVEESLADISTTLQKKVNPNLLDNWYFGNPVDQRGGYVVIPGVEYYQLGSMTVGGTTTAYYKVISIDSNGNPTFSIDGTNYWTLGANMVRGYTGAGYGIDRWKADGVVTINGGISSTQPFYQIVEDKVIEALLGKVVTLSAMNADNLVSCTYKFPDSIPGDYVKLDKLYGDEILQVYLRSGNNSQLFRFGSEVNKILAVKVELGSQQTIAHQDANGNWVLNEIPDYGEQLARCQRYCLVIGNSGYSYEGAGVGTSFSDTGVEIMVPTPTPLRTKPVVTVTGQWLLRGTGKEIGVDGNNMTILDTQSTSGAFSLSFAIPTGLTAQRAYQMLTANNTTSRIIASADL